MYRPNIDCEAKIYLIFLSSDLSTLNGGYLIVMMPHLKGACFHQGHQYMKIYSGKMYFFQNQGEKEKIPKILERKDEISIF